MWLANRFAIWLQGGAAVRLVPQDDEATNFDAFDGLLIGGGDDISAQLYGGMPVPDVRVDPAQDALEMKAIERFLPSGRPILGVCRGAQMLNVTLGGTLHSDIYEFYEAAPKMRTVLPRKDVSVLPGTALRDICQRAELRVNSLHHQSVDKLGDGLRVAARDDHDMVQAIEFTNRTGQFLLGVQWHPEFLPYRPSQRRIFASFIEAVCHTE
jgi:putative glutamine amidotransferase